MPEEIITKLKRILDNEHYSWQQINKINKHVRVLRDSKIPDSYLSSFNIEKAKFGAWDNSLSLYCEEVLHSRLRHTYTHFSKYYENLRVIGKISKSIQLTNRFSNYQDRSLVFTANI